MHKLDLLRAEQAPRREEEWGTITWFAGSITGGNGTLTLGRVVIRSGQSNPRHFHTICDEVLTLLSGEIEHTVGAELVTMAPGDTLLVPAHIPHNARCIGEEDADMIVAYSSANRDFHRVVST